MRTCEAIYGPEQAASIEELIVAATGQECPSSQGGRCPMEDRDGFNPLAVAVDRSRSVPR